MKDETQPQEYVKDVSKSKTESNSNKNKEKITDHQRKELSIKSEVNKKRKIAKKENTDGAVALHSKSNGKTGSHEHLIEDSTSIKKINTDSNVPQTSTSKNDLETEDSTKCDIKIKPPGSTKEVITTQPKSNGEKEKQDNAQQDNLEAHDQSDDNDDKKKQDGIFNSETQQKNIENLRQGLTSLTAICQSCVILYKGIKDDCGKGGCCFSCREFWQKCCGDDGCWKSCWERCEQIECCDDGCCGDECFVDGCCGDDCCDGDCCCCEDCDG